MAEVETNGSGGSTVAQYLAVNGVDVTPSDSAHAASLGIAATPPAGWQVADAGQFPGATEVLVEPGLVENGFAPNAVLLVGKLSKSVDPQALLDCSFTDARLMPGWTEVDARADDLGPWPARFVSGTFVAEQLELAVTTRYAVVGVDEQYLVQLTVTVLADQTDKLAFDIAALNDGLYIS
ncbi:LpqN/LpqT family lipoprotein [Rhodococcoides kyotonense]|uniref:Probable lipoprotein LpqN n=1 Tax=Rhodococcoides kyotonense TaxID=398843 RepID=A0A239F007_9NOCA|nr:LpqN/LpqT family lipoprotein [Rhodococcus kyotonensis]SNS49492.1 Probable lipoprotein LpqN [Rhodococcus kyotonensis]